MHFALLLHIILVGLHVLGYLNIFKVYHVSLCMFANYASSYCELYQCLLIIIMESHHHPIATDKEKNIRCQRKTKIIPTGCSTIVYPHAENELHK